MLFDAVTGHFGGNTDAACTYLIDQHPAGWSVLHGDFTTPPGYRRSTDPDDRHNQCYCHGDRHDPPRPRLDDHSAHYAWVDDADVIAPDRLPVLTDVAGGCSRSPSRPGPTPRTGTPSTPTPAAAPPVLTRPRPIDASNPTSTASTLADATSGRGVPGQGRTEAALLTSSTRDPARWLRH